MKRAAWLSLIAILAGGAGCGEVDTSTPSILLVTVDTLRADALGVYGNPGGHTPHTDALADEAIVFDNAITAIGTTFPSHTTLFTGLYPRRHGVRWNGDSLTSGFTTLAELLSAAGYETAAFVSMDSMLCRGGLSQGFSTALHWGQVHSPHPGVDVNEPAIRWVEARRKRPFFLWLHYFEPHAPYRLTPYAREELADYDGPLAKGASVKTVYSLGRQLPWTDEEKRALRVLYDGEVREVDRLVGEVLETLRRNGLDSKTIVVFTSDHGQALGEHGDVGHGFLLSQPVLHVPLLIRAPGLMPRRVSDRAGLIDLLPTLLDLLEQPVPPGLDGRTLKPLLEGRSLPPQRYFAEAQSIGRHMGQLRRLWSDSKELAQALSKSLQQDPGAVAVFDEGVKGIWRLGGFRAYDLTGDPGETDALAFEPGSSRLEELRALAAAYHENAEVEASRLEFSETVRKELEALGYIQ